MATIASPVATPARAAFANQPNGPASEATGIRTAPAIVPIDASIRPGRSQARCSFLGCRRPAAANARYPIPVTTFKIACVCGMSPVSASASAATPTTANTIASGNADASVPMNRYQTSPKELHAERVMTDTIDASGSARCSYRSLSRSCKISSRSPGSSPHVRARSDQLANERTTAPSRRTDCDGSPPPLSVVRGSWMSATDRQA